MALWVMARYYDHRAFIPLVATLLLLNDHSSVRNRRIALMTELDKSSLKNPTVALKRRDVFIPQNRHPMPGQTQRPPNAQCSTSPAHEPA